MELPSELQEAIENQIRGKDLSLLAKASQELSSQYRHRENSQKKFMNTDEHRLAYMMARMPGTYAALKRVLSEVKLRLNDFSPKSILDLGAGPGTATWAANDEFPSIQQSTLLEIDQDLIALGKRLASQSCRSSISQATWKMENLEQSTEFASHDLVIISYAIGELNKSSISKLVQEAWQASQQICVIIEPGSKYGFERILLARDELIKAGAHLIAPCPHANQCPLLGKEDWCHFSQRLERSFLHRYAKGASMGFEDEKFSYIVASRHSGQEFRARILRHPEKHSGHMRFELCTSTEGIKKETISRKQGEVYKQARHLDWGDVL